MPKVQLREETVERLEGLRVEGESYDDIINELINIYQAGEMTTHHAGEEY